MEYNLIATINDVVEERYSIRSVAKKYSTARLTLQNKLKDKIVLVTKKGLNSIFNQEQESNIYFWITSMANTGFPITKEILIHSVAKFIKEY